MAISQDDLALAKSNIAETIGKYIELKKDGSRYKACCPFHDEGSPSFTVNTVGDYYHCFGCGVSGDAITFVKEYLGCSFKEAVEKILGNLSPDAPRIVPTKKKAVISQWHPIRPAVSQPEPEEFIHYKLGTPASKWLYREADGTPIGYVCRFDISEAGKETLPLSQCRNETTGEIRWRWQGFAKPRPLYGMDGLRDGFVALLVEGEKTRDVAAKIFPGQDCLTWPGGAGGINAADLSPLYGRRIVLWPDNDAPGLEVMRRVTELLDKHCEKIMVVPPPPDHPKGWDLADETAIDVVSYAKMKITDARQYYADPVPARKPEPEPAAPFHPEAQIKHPDDDKTGFSGQPVDIFSIHAPDPIPMDALPDAIVPYVRDQSELMGSDPSIMAITAITSIASVLHDGIEIQPLEYDTGWTESAILWSVVVGEPSTKKTPAMQKVTKQLSRIDARLNVENERVEKDHEHQLRMWKAAVKKDETLQMPEKPKSLRVMIEDATIAAASDILQDNERGIGCFRDEISSWIGSFDAFNGGGMASMDKGNWLQAYNGGPRMIDRAGNRKIRVPNWSVCMMGGIQPGIIRKIVKNLGNDGLLQRFMVICAHDAGMYADRVPDEKAAREFAELFDAVYAMPPSSRPVTLSRFAHDSRLRVSQYAMKFTKVFVNSPMQAWVGKWDGLYARILLVYHAIECAVVGVHPTNREVSGETACKVEKLICGSLLHHALYFYREIVDTHERNENIRNVGRVILAHKLSSINKREIVQRLRNARNFEWNEWLDIINNLCIMEWITPDPQSIGIDGRANCWLVNPVVHTKFSEMADRVKARNAETVKIMLELRERFKPQGV